MIGKLAILSAVVASAVAVPQNYAAARANPPYPAPVAGTPCPDSTTTTTPPIYPATEQPSTPCATSVVPQQDASTPCATSVVPQQAASTPCETSVVPQQDASTPYQNPPAPQQDASTPYQNPPAPQQDASTPCETNVVERPQQDTYLSPPNEFEPNTPNSYTGSNNPSSNIPYPNSYPSSSPRADSYSKSYPKSPNPAKGSSPYINEQPDTPDSPQYLSNDEPCTTSTSPVVQQTPISNSYGSSPNLPVNAGYGYSKQDNLNGSYDQQKFVNGAPQYQTPQNQTPGSDYLDQQTFSAAAGQSINLVSVVGAGLVAVGALLA